MGISIEVGFFFIKTARCGYIMNKHLVGALDDLVQFLFLRLVPLSVSGADLFVFTGFNDLRFYPYLLHESTDIGTVHNNTDRADHRTGVGDDLIGIDRSIVRAACQCSCCVDNYGLDLFQTFDSVHYFERRGYSAAWRVNG